MMINIPKIQLGGGLPPYVSYTPVTVNNATGDYSSSYDADTSSSKKSSSSSSDDAKGEITNKDLLSMLKDIDGLPSDMLNLYESLNRFYKMQDTGIPNTTSLSRQYLQAIQLIKTAKYNKEVFDTAYKNLEKNGGLNEVAISATGKLIGMNKEGELKLLSIDEALNTKDYQVMTNAELLLYRAELPTFAMDNDMIKFAGNGIGMEKVGQLIKDNLQKLGTNSLTLEGYINGKNSDGLKLLQELMSSDKANAGTDLDGLYKAKIVSKEQLSKIKGVLNYAYQMLPENAKTLLAVKNGGSKENAYNLIYQMLVGTADNTSEISLDYIEDSNGDKPGSKEKTSSEDVLTNPILNIQNGLGGDVGTFTLNNGTLAQMLVNGTNYRSLIDKSGNTINSTNLSDMLAKSGLLSIIDTTSVSFGNLSVKSDDLNKIVYRNNGGTRVILPCIKNNGKITPNFELLDIYKEIIDKVNQECTELTPIEQRKRIEGKYLKAAGLDQLVDNNGYPDMNLFGLFFVVDGYASTKNIKITDDNKYAQDVSDDNLITDFIEQTLTTNEKSPYQTDRYSWYNPADWFGNYDKSYSASVYIPIVSNNKLLAITGYGDKVKESLGFDKQLEYLRFLKMQHMLSSSSDLL